MEISYKESSKNIRRSVGDKLSGGINNKCFKLLYTAEEKVDVNEFHLKCNAKGPTLTILHGIYNTKFGGYTSQDWSSENKRVKRDEDAFLFFMNDNEGADCTFIPIKTRRKDKAITCDANFGPTFGAESLMSRFDLQVFRKDSNPKSAEKDIPRCMNLNGNIDIGYSYKTKLRGGTKIKSGDINSGKLQVRKIEVFQVLDDELPKPWKTKPGDDEFIKMKKELEMKETIAGLDIKKYNILLTGAVGAGKSSLYNTLAAVFAGKVVMHAPAIDSDSSVTNMVKAYNIITECEQELCVRIFDIRGFEYDRSIEQELEPLLNGKLPVGYRFLEEPNPIESVQHGRVTLNDEIHLLCFVHGTSEPTHHVIIEQIRKIKDINNQKGLPMVVVATKLDQHCENISEDADHLYQCIKARAVIASLSKFFGVRENHVFPVVNYTTEEKISKGKDRLALQALSSMVDLAAEYLAKHTDKEKKLDEFIQRGQRLSSLKPNAETESRRLVTEMARFESEELRILCIGAVHSGKTSFIDSVSSALMRKICCNTEAHGACGGFADYPNTMMFQMHKIGDRRSNVLFGDMPGFDKAGRITKKHVQGIVEGIVPEKFNFKGALPTVQNDTEDKFHCVCVFFDCKSIAGGLPGELHATISSVLELLNGKGIPYIVILTKGDKISAKTQFNKLQAYESTAVKNCVQILMAKFGFRQNIIFPVINYIQENDVDAAGDILLLDVLNEILKLGRNVLECTRNSVKLI